MQLRIPKWYLLALLSVLLLSTGTTASSGFVMAARNNGDDSNDSDTDGDSDSDSDSDNDSSHHRGKGTLTKHKLSGGAIAGIVIGSLLLLFFLILCVWCCIRRKRNRQRNNLVAAAAPQMKEASSSHLLAQRAEASRTLPVLVTGPTYPVTRGTRSPEGSRHENTEEMRNIARGSEESAHFPNPYDGDTPPQPPPRDDIQSSPISPSSPTSHYTSYYGDLSRPSGRQSSAPSAWTYDEAAVALLSRETTQASRLTASSSLHDELSGYQKALEAHHRKEEEDAVRRQSGVGEGSSVPLDPPPVYSASEEM